MSNILILGSYPPPYGGVPVHVELLSKYLSVKNTINVLAGGSTGRKRYGSIIVHKPTISNKITSLVRFPLEIKVFEAIFLLKLNLNQGISRTSMKRLIRQLILLSYLRTNQLTRDIDIVLSYNSLEYAPVGYLFANTNSLPTIISIFGEIYMNNFLKKSAEFIQILSKADTLLSCSSHCATSIKLITDNLNVHPIVYGADVNRFNSRVKLEERKYDLLFVGRLSKVMGLDDFLKVIDMLPDSRTYNVAIGGAKGDLYNKLKSYNPPKHVQVDVMCDLSIEKLAKLYSDSAIYLMLSKELRSCSSLSSIEAMMSSCYVMARGIGGVPELFPSSTKVGELIPSEINASEIAKKIEVILNSLKECQIIADHANSYAISNYDAINPLKVTSKLINSILSK